MVPPRESSVDDVNDVEAAFAAISCTADSRAGCAATRVQRAGVGIEGRRPGKSRAQYGDDRETSSLGAMED